MIRSNKFNLSFNEIHIWQAHTSHLDIDYENYLSPAELLRANNLFCQRSRINFVAHRCIIKKIIAKYIALPPEKINFSYNAHGKPYLKNHNFHFNLAHSGEYMLFAITINTEIGIDVEQYTNELNYLDIAKNIFSTNEYQILLNCNDDARQLEFYRYWTRKESIIKAVGSGLNSYANQIDTIYSLVQLKGLWYLTEICQQDGYIATLASRYKYPKVQLFHWAINYDHVK